MYHAVLTRTKIGISSYSKSVIALSLSVPKVIPKYKGELLNSCLGQGGHSKERLTVSLEDQGLLIELEDSYILGQKTTDYDIVNDIDSIYGFCVSFAISILLMLCVLDCVFVCDIIYI